MANEYGPYQDAVNNDTEWQHGACVVRITPGSFHTDPEDSAWYYNTGASVYANSAHVAVGAEKVRFNKSGHYMRVYAPGVQVGMVTVTGDETTAKYGLRFGGSGGNNGINVYGYWPNGNKFKFANAAQYGSVAENGHNLWISWSWPSLRGSGGPSRIAQLEEQTNTLAAYIADLEARLDVLEQYHPWMIFDETEFG